MYTRYRLTCVLLVLSALLASAEPPHGVPEGYTLVAEDDCGDPDNMPHVVRGTEYVFALGMASGPLSYRDVVFDNQFCLLRYKGLVPAASHKVDVVYVTQAGAARVQTLLANGVIVHDELALPFKTPGRFVFDIPAAAYADGGPLELKFVRAAGANAVVSYVRVWSTDSRALPGLKRVWAPTNPIERDWARQDRLLGRPNFGEWQDPAKEVAESVLPSLDGLLTRGQQILADLTALAADDLAASVEQLAKAAQGRDRLVAAESADPRAWLEVYLAARWAVRRLAFKNPLLDCDGLLFVRRQHPHHMHQCARRLGSFTRPGGDVCVLKEIRADGKGRVERITAGQFPRGTFGRPDLSFDGKRAVFGYARQREPGTDGMHPGPISQHTAPLYATHKVGFCHEFQVWEMGLDGASPAPRKLTAGPCENADPLYLPDGRIAFMSHRAGGLVQCGDWALAYCVLTMAPDGSDVRQITVSKDGEWDPFLLEDGTVGFTRWDYVMKFWSPIQMLWAVRPDGTNPRMIYGSDMSRNYPYLLNYAAARQIPGTSKLVCIGSAHHNTGAGPLCLVDLSMGPNVAEGMRRITPVRFVETPDQQPHSGWYDCPFPLSEKYFLVSYTFSRSEADTCGYAIYLFDTYGGKELVYRDEEFSALFPIPIRARRTPGVVAETAEQSIVGHGELIVHDVYEGLPPSVRGSARYVQVVEVHERHIHTRPYNIQVGPDSGFAAKTVLGTAPVESDGSAYFRVPVGKSILFSVLDETYRALHTMRSVTNVQDGERTSCVGCHEPHAQTPSTRRRLLATGRAVSPLEPPPWGVCPMEYTALVQPVLDRHCIRCHDGQQAEGKSFDLAAGRSRPFMGVALPVSYFNLRRFVRHAPMHSYHLLPGTFGSRVSPVVERLAKGHNRVKLSAGDWRVLCAWIDCNAPCLGRYDNLDDLRAKPQELDPLPYDRTHIAARKEQLSATAPADAILVCYVDCGPEIESAGEGGPALRQTRGSTFMWGNSDEAAPGHFGSIAFADTEVVFEATGLAPDKTYQVAFTWWDYDAGKRVQSVHVEGGEPCRSRSLLEKASLPAYRGQKQAPEQTCVAVPAELHVNGKLRVIFRKDGGANAVVSEVWLWQSG